MGPVGVWIRRDEQSCFTDGVCLPLRRGQLHYRRTGRNHGDERQLDTLDLRDLIAAAYRERDRGCIEASHAVAGGIGSNACTEGDLASSDAQVAAHTPSPPPWELRVQRSVSTDVIRWHQHDPMWPDHGPQRTISR